jgi:hypothetical protein
MLACLAHNLAVDDSLPLHHRPSYVFGPNKSPLGIIGQHVVPAE